MKVKYKGTDPNYPYRIAEIGYEEKEEQTLEAIASIMTDFGWNIDIVGSQTAKSMILMITNHLWKIGKNVRNLLEIESEVLHND